MPPARADNPFLAEILDALQKRNRALKHQNAVLTIDRIVEVNNGEAQERLDIGCISRKRQSIRLVVRSDRSVWIHACEAIAKAGWKFQFTDSGRLGGPHTGRDLVAALEASLSTMFELTADDVHRLAQIWEPLLAKGPRAV